MNLNIKNKTALITGGANGIGEVISEKLASEGVNLIITSRSSKNINLLKKKLKKYNVNIYGFNLDFLKKNWKQNLRKNISKFKSIDILVNNAGHNLEITNPYCGLSEWKRLFDLNFFSVVELSNLVIKKMKKKKWGRIINISSVAAFENMGPVTYCVAKSSVAVYSHVMGRILATEDKNIVMSCILPGVVKTKNGHWSKVSKYDPARVRQYLKERCPLGRFGTSEEIANAVLYQCSDLASFSHGSIISVDGGQSKNYMSFNYL